MTVYKIYVLSVATGKEIDIRNALNKKGYNAIVPRENRLIHKKGEWSQCEYVLFTGYVFLKVEQLTDADYYAVKNTPQISKFLGNGRPETITGTEAQRIGILAPSPAPLEPSVVEFDEFGTPRIISGVLAQMEVEKFDKHRRRATVLFDINGKAQAAKLSFEIKEPLK